MPSSSQTLIANPTWNGLFPASVVTVTQSELADTPALMPEERSFLARAVPARVLEFTTGRSCARAALARLGCPPVAIAVGDEREPLWPPGFIGSITHRPGHCAAAVARCEPHLIAGLGFDAEPAQALPEDVLKVACCPGEQEWIRQRSPRSRSSAQETLRFERREFRSRSTCMAATISALDSS